MLGTLDECRSTEMTSLQQIKVSFDTFLSSWEPGEFPFDADNVIYCCSVWLTSVTNVTKLFSSDLLNSNIFHVSSMRRSQCLYFWIHWFYFSAHHSNWLLCDSNSCVCRLQFTKGARNTLWVWKMQGLSGHHGDDFCWSLKKPCATFKISVEWHSSKLLSTLP